MKERRSGIELSRKGTLVVKVCLVLLAAIASATLGDALQINKRVRTAAEAVVQHRDNDQRPGQSSPAYSAVLQKQIVMGAKSTQGLSYNQETGTLLTVLENEQAIAELDRCGVVLRHIDIQTDNPIEEISTLEEGYALLTFANTNTITLIRIPKDSTSLTTQEGIQLNLQDGKRTLEIEEVTWDRNQKRIFLASREYPPRIYWAQFDLKELKSRKYGPHKMQASEWIQTERIQKFMPDITALAYSSVNRQLLVLSDETREIVSVDEDRVARPYLQLEQGTAGLEATIRSPEGMTIATDGSIYLISDPDNVYLYRFYPEIGLTRQMSCNSF